MDTGPNCHIVQSITLMPVNGPMGWPLLPFTTQVSYASATSLIAQGRPESRPLHLPLNGTLVLAGLP